MTGEQVVRVVRAVTRHLAALADDLEQITTPAAPVSVSSDPGRREAPGSEVWT